jgi:polyisoprenoid-binding protein YceI
MATTTQVSVPTGTWTVDPAHSSVEFRVKHLGISTVRGTFDEFEGTLEVGEDTASTRAHGQVVASSINTNEHKRDEHLRSPDFFHAEVYPELVFEATEITPLDEDTFAIVGELTMLGVTRPIGLKAELQGTETDLYGNDRVGLEISGQLDRGDYGMTFNQALGSGNLLVSDKVKLNLDISAVKQAD